MPERLTKLQDLLKDNPQDRFAHYGLAMEYARLGQLDEAVRQFRALVAMDPDYVAAYLQAGQTLEKLGRTEEAKAVYRQGIEAARRREETRAQEELEAALGFLG
jgi:tetratricopeptide (TPR) repeat protein